MALLDGLRVVEVALLAPNMLGMHLADLGADVVKVEDTGAGDYTRHVGGAKAGGVSFLHLRWNRGKRSVVLDLRHPDGAEAFRDLARWADVVIEGLRAGALAHRGLGYDDLIAINPRLVFCSLSGFGQSGPLRDLATHGVAYDAYAGLALPETTDDGFPTIPSRYFDIGTQAGALYGAMAVLAAVIRARDTGHGTNLDIAQADAAVAWNAGRLDPLLSGASAGPRGGMQGAVRYQYYLTADGRTILFQASERHFFERFCRAVDRQDLLHTEGAEFGEHARGNVALRRELASIFATRTQAEWIELFLHEDIAGAPVHSAAELPDDPQFRARTRLVEHDHPHAGPLRLIGSPVRTADPPAPMRPAPGQGEHTDEVLRDVLGYDEARIARLRARGVFGSPHTEQRGDVRDRGEE
jgi:crotonobetainyl-CoA:carnitine CoA-transferase CaiB-like acyl-CoA transferase